jgi:hypothetical protein
VNTAIGFVLGVVLALCSLLGCAELPPIEAPKNKADTQAAIDNACTAASALCNVYETLPPEHRNARDDASCKDVHEFCVEPASAPAK